MGENWVEIAERLKYKEGVSWTDLPGELKKRTGQDMKPSKIRATLRRRPAYSLRKGAPGEPEAEPAAVDVDKLNSRLISDLSERRTLPQLAKMYNLSPRIIGAAVEDLKEQGYNIWTEGEAHLLRKDLPPQENRVEFNWRGDKILRFGVVADTHFSSFWAQITHLNDIYDWFACEGIDTVYHAGDIDEGEKMRPGHEYEIYTHGADAHMAEIVKNYPFRKEILTKFITGNHDYSFVKTIGLNIGKMIAAARPDLEYLGHNSTSINLTPNCTMEIRHPGDGTSYADSYKLQKMIDAMQGGEKPHILLVGHYHKPLVMPAYRNIHAMLMACVQAQTDWAKGRGIRAVVGGWIIEIHVDEEGSIREIVPRFRTYYRMIPNDWKNYQ